MNPMSAEAAVVRTYLDWIIEAPRKVEAGGHDHPKRRLSIENITDSTRSSCASSNTCHAVEPCAARSLPRGPPGVGRTSLARCAAATERPFVRSHWLGRDGPNFGDTAEPTSAPCPGVSFKEYDGPGAWTA